jgi:hypothetical protein
VYFERTAEFCGVPDLLARMKMTAASVLALSVPPNGEAFGLSRKYQ